MERNEMHVRDAFEQQAIIDADANVDEQQEGELRAMIREIYDSNQLEIKPEEENVAVFCFVAGRSFEYHEYQEDQGSFPVVMSNQLAGEFMEFLMQRGAP
jgi:hypothetical protein